MIFEETREKFEHLKKEFDDIFSKNASDIGTCPLAEMSIDTIPGSLPAASKPCKMKLQHAEFLRKEVQALLETKVIVPSISKYATPCMVVPWKHKPGAPIRERYRLVINYRGLNRTLTLVDCKSNNPNETIAIVPTPRIEDMWAPLKDRFFFSSLNLGSGYHHILIKDEDQHKTAFVTDFGKFQFTRASFGIAMSPDYLKDVINKLFLQYHEFCLVYMDDLLISSKTQEDHLEHI